MNYGEAIDILKSGGVVTRKIFKDEYRFKLSKGIISENNFIQEKIFNFLEQSLFDVNDNVDNPKWPSILCTFKDGNEYSGWLLSDVDILADDWIPTEPFDSNQKLLEAE